MRNHHGNWAAELAALQTDGPAPPDVPCVAYERCTGAYIAERSVATDVTVPVGSVSVLKLIRNATAAAMTRHKKTYAWPSARRDGGVLRVYAKVSTNPSGLRNLYSRGFRNDLKSTGMFASVTAFDEWARARCVWPYVPSAVVCCINAGVAAGCKPYVRFAGSMHAVRMAGEFVMPGSVTRESTPGTPIVVHTQHTVKMYTHTNQTELLISTDVGEFGLMACPRYSAPYASTSAFTLTRLPDGRSREFEKENIRARTSPTPRNTTTNEIKINWNSQVGVWVAQTTARAKKDSKDSTGVGGSALSSMFMGGRASS